MTKRVLIFSLAYYPFVGGAEVALKEITDRLGADFSFDMITLRFDPALPRQERIGNILVHRVGLGLRGVSVSGSYHPLLYLSKIFFLPFAAFTAFKLHRARRFDAMWAMMVYMLFPIMLLRLFGNRTPYLLTLQEGDPFEHVFHRLRIAPFRAILKRGFRSAAAVQAISEHLAGWARKMGAHRVEVIPNGVDLARFSNAARFRNAMRKKLGIPGSSRVLITVSRLVEKNAVDDILRALALLPEDVLLLVVGAGPEEGALKRLANDLGVPKRVRFLGGISHGELPGYFGAADVFVRPSLSEGMGNAFIEAMAAGVPIIGTREGGIADFLFDPERNQDREATGRAVLPRDPRGIARQVEAYGSDAEATRRIIANADALVHERFSFNDVAARVGKMLGGLVLSASMSAG